MMFLSVDNYNQHRMGVCKSCRLTETCLGGDLLQKQAFLEARSRGCSPCFSPCGGNDETALVCPSQIPWLNVPKAHGK